MNRDRIVTFCFIALLLFIVYQVFRIFSPFSNSIFWGAILAFGFYPMYKPLKRAFGKHEGIAAFTMTAF